LDRQVGQERLDLLRAEVARMALAMEQGETPYSIDIGLLGADAIVFHT
jgi:hypothetical protein